MFDVNSLASYSSGLLDTSEDTELRQRLGLYQVFLKIYEHHRSLLDEILNLEQSGSKCLPGMMLPYMQGVILHQTAYLVTNLAAGETQALKSSNYVWTIGRDSRQVALPIRDRRLSRCHATICYENQAFHLTDLDSSNGSFVNGEQVRQRFQLKDGDRIRLGSLTFTFFVCDLTQLTPATAAATDAGSPSLASSPQPSVTAKEAESPASPTQIPASPRLDETLTFMRTQHLEEVSADVNAQYCEDN